MKIILSRKGFDSGSGGVPSPIFPNGKMLSLPIPDKISPIVYSQIKISHEIDCGQLVEDLTNSKVKSWFGAHLDPDINPISQNRKEGWKPVFGQINAPQGHLKNENISIGDIFLFFGLFKDILKTKAKYKFDAGSLRKHVIWGWLQIGEIVPVDNCPSKIKDWANYHPHFGRTPNPSNTLYIASEELNIPGINNSNIPGAGAFNHYDESLCLTAPNSQYVSKWQLPRWFYPENKKPLTFHPSLSSWKLLNNHVLLQSAKRGQEFVLDVADYPESIQWLSNEILVHCQAIQKRTSA